MSQSDSPKLMGPWQTVVLYVLTAVVLALLIAGLAFLADVAIHGWPR